MPPKNTVDPLVRCRECGSLFPISELYALMYGVDSWTCPACALKKALADMKKGEEYAQ